MNESENNNGILHWIAVSVIGAGLLFIVDWVFGDVMAMIIISAGVLATMVGSGLSAVSVWKLVTKLGDNSGTKVLEWWYSTAVPAQSPDRMVNPTKEELMEFLAWKMEQEQKAAAS